MQSRGQRPELTSGLQQVGSKVPPRTRDSSRSPDGLARRERKWGPLRGKDAAAGAGSRVPRAAGPHGTAVTNHPRLQETRARPPRESFVPRLIRCLKRQTQQLSHRRRGFSED